MINQKNFWIVIFLILLSIYNASCLTLKFNQISNFKCDTAYGLFKFNLEAKEVTNELKLIPFYVYFQDIEGESSYLSICRLEDEEKLKNIAEGANDAEDISFTCSLESMIVEFKSSEVEILEVSDFKGEAIDLQNVGNSSITFNLVDCQVNLDEYNLSIVKRKISFRQVSHYQTLKDENKINFVFSVFISQTLPDNYAIPVRVSLVSDDISENIDIGGMDIGEGLGGDQISGEAQIDINGGIITDAICILNKAIKPSENQVLSANLECSAFNQLELNDKTSLYVISSDIINGFTVDISFLSPSETDELISEGLIKDVSNESELPPIFTHTTIISEQCNELRIFYFKGKFDKNIEERGEFRSVLLSGSPISCYYDKVEKDVEVEIKCLLDLGLISNRIIIDSNLILGVNTEKFLLKANLF